MHSRTRNRTRTSPLGPGRDFRFTIRERKERELNPQGTQHARPASNRFPSPFGWPFRCLFNASTRTRTQNIPLEAGHDLHFTTEALQKRKARDSNPHLPRGRAALAVRSGQPYPATFRILHSSVDPPGVEPESPPCHSGVVPLDYEPVLRRQWTAGELNPDLLVATQMSCRWTSSPFFERSVRELNPIFRLTKAVCSRNTYRPSLSNDPGWS